MKKEINLEYPWKYNADQFWPFNGIVNDLYRGIQAGENYLVALGLFCYSEYIGREIRRVKNAVAFREFTKNYIEYPFSEWEWGKVYGDIRNGLTHEYFIKGDGVVVNDFEGGGIYSCGINYSSDGRIKVYIYSYFKHFVRGLEKYLDEKEL